ncbi:hypothetical protein [Ramlibacter sp. PS4R-6]|uniref:hypothetical protein n=1 Tax=Ramlibacter sp. PS4R-6 TaxID=3133438 RepID=UPI003098397E
MKDDKHTPVSPGTTATEQGETQERVPRQPNEHDESADSQASGEASQQRMGEIARRDVESGRVDTDKGPVLRELHEKKI